MASNDIVLQLGQHLLVQTASELLTGTLKFVDPQRKIIELENAYDQRTNCRYNSSQILAFPLIKSIQILRDDDGNSSPTTTASSDTANSDSSPAPASHSDSDVSNLSSTEMELIQDQVNSMVFITQTDQRYHKALADIRTHPVVGLLVDPCDYGRAQRTSVLAIATQKTAYIFDILCLGSIFREIKQLLEAERPRKAVHYSHRLVDHLQNRHGVKLGGIFDTFVAISLVQGCKKPMTLLEAIEQTLNITPFYFQPDVEGVNPPSKDPYKRPLTVEMCQVLAKKAIFQLKLHEHLLHKHMLRNFYNQCENFSQTFCENQDATTPLEMQRRSRAGFEHIKRNSEEFAFKFNELKYDAT